MRECYKCKDFSHRGRLTAQDYERGYCARADLTFRMNPVVVEPAPLWCPLINEPSANMGTYEIWVDQRGYRGESLDETDGTQNAGLGNGFHNYQSEERAKLLWGNKPIPIETVINLRSHLERILDRMRHNQLEPDEIIIRRVTA